MATWSDNFNRANGSLGPAWVVVSGSASIVSQKYQSGSASWSRIAALTASGYASVQCTLNTTNYNGYYARPVVKATASFTQGYYFDGQGAASSPNWAIRKYNSPTDTLLASGTYAIDASLPHTIRLVYNAGVLTGYVDGVAVCTASDSVLASNVYVGVFPGTAGIIIDDVLAEGDVAKALFVNPQLCGTADPAFTVYFTGVGTSWTSGTPGTPLIGASGGTLTAQTILSATTATATYTPPTTAQTVTFYDPDNGTSATLSVLSGASSGGSGGGLGGLPADVVSWLQAQSAHGGLVLADVDALTDAPPGDLIKKSLGDVLSWLNNYVNPLNPDLTGMEWGGWMAKLLNNNAIPDGTHNLFDYASTTDYYVQLIYPLLNTLTSDGAISLSTVVSSLEGVDVIDNTQLKAAIDAISGSDLTPVLDAIAATRGDTTTSLATLLSSLAGIRTTHTYSLGDVKDWVDALPHGEAGPNALAVVAFIAALALAIPSGGASIAAEAVAVGAGPLLDIATLVEVVSILGELAGIASSVESIRDSLSPSGALTAPVWPGEANVTLGTPHVLTDQLYMVEPMDGVIISVTTAPSKTGLRQIGGALYDYGVGEIAFETDSGHIEMWQYLGFRSMIATPKSMARAAGARFRVLAGASGTVTPWTSS